MSPSLDKKFSFKDESCKNENVLMGLKTGTKNSRNLLMGMKIKMRKLAVGTENVQRLKIKIK